MEECCATCACRFRLVKFDYSHGGCEHTNMEGYLCMGLVYEDKGEGPATWMVGVNPQTGMCECYTPKKSKAGTGK